MIADLARPSLSVVGQSLAAGLGLGAQAAAANPSNIADQYLDAQVEAASLQGDGSLGWGGKACVAVGFFVLYVYLTRK